MSQVADLEACYAALWARLVAVQGLRTTSRRLLHWADVPGGQQPALFMAQAGARPIQQTKLPARWNLGGRLYLYVQTPAPAAPGPVLNLFLRRIAQAFEPGPAEEVQTLGGLVHWARIEGEIETDEGTLGDQAVAIVPFEILTL